tara:strand:+ start:2692 stop:3600 length:909 start_codon:yes stop_codon:yes gene_type:complete
MSYFKKFPTVLYDYNRDGVQQTATDLFRQVRTLQNFVDSYTSYTYYNIQDGERPDIVSRKLYGNQSYYWTFFIINDFLHDGIGSWPMSERDLVQYLETEFEGWALETRPNIKRNTDQQITDYENSLAGRFTVGQKITGATSGAIGTLTKKDIYLNQLIVQDMENNKDFLGAGDNNTVENVSGNRIDGTSITTDTVKVFKAWKYADAPHHYYKSGDGKTDTVTNPDGSTTYGVEADVSSANFFSTTDNADTNLIIQEGSTAAAQYVSNRQYIYDQNDARSKIRVIEPANMPAFVSSFESLLNE